MDSNLANTVAKIIQFQSCPQYWWGWPFHQNVCSGNEIFTVHCLDPCWEKIFTMFTPMLWRVGI